MTIGTQIFIDYLVTELNLDESAKPDLGSWGRIGTTLGALSLKLNLMDMEKINNLLEIQEQTGGLFGDVAIELGYLDTEQVRKLLNIQSWSRRAEILHRLLLTGMVDEEKYQELASKVYTVN